MNAKEMTRLLELRFCAPEYAFLPQVRNTTGFGSGTIRTADGLAMSLYPSRGLHLHGFEIKVARSDWKRELEQPDKADEIGKHCHYWWIVAPDTKVVPIEELPGTWGLLVEKDGKLRVAKQAVLMPDAIPLPMTMLASIFRNVASQTVRASDVQRRIDEAVAQANEMFRRNHERELAKLHEREQRIEEFEQRAGIKIESWNLDNIADAVRRIQRERHSDAHPERMLESARRIVANLERVAAQAKASLAELEQDAA